MKSKQQSFLFFELVNGSILTIILYNDETNHSRELKKAAKSLSKDFGLEEQDVVWVRYFPAGDA